MRAQLVKFTGQLQSDLPEQRRRRKSGTRDPIGIQKIIVKLPDIIRLPDTAILTATS